MLDNSANKFDIVICPGIHPPNLTKYFIQGLQEKSNCFCKHNWLILSTQNYAPYAPLDVYLWLKTHYPSPINTPPLVFISFSAGVVGGFGAALMWQMNGGRVKALFALDGWGVPLLANFPIYRLSHDYFTHWSSALLGAGDDSFYADPTVEHLELWRAPDATWGWWHKSSGIKIRCSVADFFQIFLGKI